MVRATICLNFDDTQGIFGVFYIQYEFYSQGKHLWVKLSEHVCTANYHGVMHQTYFISWYSRLLVHWRSHFKSKNIKIFFIFQNDFI